ncbi:hypothetical protein OPV22_012659 [Ensete ventricosum]|uniref:Tetratricopeptide repeat protein n=1 Tax=Ensete ventricosum TaxID=4639 RepID=A0AAV8QZB0_ENSVE|nr:hypothetical protein OPV22_012659 [Ensete ventricosum]
MVLAVGRWIHVSAVGAMTTKAPSILLSSSRLRHSSGTLSAAGPGWKRRSLLLSAAAASLLECRNSVAAGPSFDPVTDREREASADLSRRVSDAIRLLDLARDLQAKGDYSQALDYFTLVIRDYKEFAFADYARVGRALVLYEIGDRDEAIAEMEDVSISLKGYPEIHAALAAALYADKHAALLAENQFAIATLLDPHYTDLSYVRETKHWPPSLDLLLVQGDAYVARMRNIKSNSIVSSVRLPAI